MQFWTYCAVSSFLGFRPEMFQIFGEELRYLLESAYIFGISLHQRPVRFQARARHFLFRRI